MVNFEPTMSSAIPKAPERAIDPTKPVQPETPFKAATPINPDVARQTAINNAAEEYLNGFKMVNKRAPDSYDNLTDGAFKSLSPEAQQEVKNRIQRRIEEEKEAAKQREELKKQQDIQNAPKHAQNFIDAFKQVFGHYPTSMDNYMNGAYMALSTHAREQIDKRIKEGIK